MATIKELKSEASALKIKGYSRMSKLELEDAVNNAFARQMGCPTSDKKVKKLKTTLTKEQLRKKMKAQGVKKISDIRGTI